MTRLAFCDDDPNIHDQLTALLEKYRTQRKADLECTAFRSPLDLLAAIESGARYDIQDITISEVSSGASIAIKAVCVRYVSQLLKEV